jgi:hypothetical protein
MPLKFTARGVHFFLVGLVLGLLIAAQANADAIYQSPGQPLASSDETSATPLTARFLLHAGTFRYGHDGPCTYECGSTALLSWTTSGSVDAPDSSDGFPDKDGYGAVVLVDAEGDITYW